jgi:hypothetical protein
MTRRRTPQWAAAVERLDGSALAKARLRAVLETLTGRRTVAEACRLLGLRERRFHELRNVVLQAALAGLEPRPAGRPPRPAAEPGGRVAALEATVRDLQLDLRAAQVREEIALMLPQLRRGAGRAKPPPRRKAGRRQPGGKSGACGGCAPSGRASRPGRFAGVGLRASGRAASGSAGSGPARWPSTAGRPAWGYRWRRRPGGSGCRRGP